jgi:protein-L-isoaspartate(D-aspartate) O-methyltransferase
MKGSNAEMVDDLVLKGRISSARVEKAFRSVDRRLFVPEGEQHRAYADRPVSIAEGATVSAPSMVAVATELLELEEDHRVLEMGSGSGYHLAILSELAREVVGVDFQEELVRLSRQRMEQFEAAEVVHGSSPSDADGCFDRAVYSFATPSLEPALEVLEQAGVVVGPVEEEGSQRLKRWEKGATTDHGPVRYVGSLG